MTATVVSSRTKLLEGFEAENRCFEEDMLSRKPSEGILICTITAVYGLS